MGLTEENWFAGNRRTNRRICGPCNNARVAKWAKANREKERARKARYRKENPEKVRAYDVQFRAGFPAVYVIVNPVMPGYVKIGRTGRRASVRLAHYNTCDPLKRYEYAAFVPVDDDRAAERLLHDTLSADRERLDGEWFEVETEVAVRLAESLRKRSDCNDDVDS